MSRCLFFVSLYFLLSSTSSLVLSSLTTIRDDRRGRAHRCSRPRSLANWNPNPSLTQQPPVLHDFFAYRSLYQVLTLSNFMSICLLHNIYFFSEKWIAKSRRKYFFLVSDFLVYLWLSGCWSFYFFCVPAYSAVMPLQRVLVYLLFPLMQCEEAKKKNRHVVHRELMEPADTRGGMLIIRSNTIYSICIVIS
jgi:hypothetical protein